MADRYWVGGTASWDTTALLKWSTTSGGAGGAAVPTAADDVYFDANSGVVTVSMTQDGVCKNISFTSGAGNFSGTFTSGSNLTVSGSLTLVSGMSWTFTNTITFNSTTTGSTITSAGKTLTAALTFNGVGGGWQFQDNTTCTGILTLTAGAVDFNNKAITASTFSSSNANTRSIAFGTTGSLNLTGSGGALFNLGTVSNWTCTGSRTVNINNNTATASTINTGGPAEANTLSFYLTTGTYTLTESSAFYNTLDLTGFSGTLPNTTRRIYRDLVISSTCTLTAGTNATSFRATSGTQKVTTANKTLDFPITQNTAGATVQLQDNLTMGSTRLFTLTAGTLDLTGNSGNWVLSTGLFDSNNSNTRSILFGTGAITTTGSGTVWNTGTVTNFSQTGIPTVNISNNSATATTVSTGALSITQALSFNYTIGTYTLTDTVAVYKSVNFTGFAGTIPNSVRTVYGSFTLASGMTLTAGANATTFVSTSAGNTITSAGKTQDYPLIFNGIGGVWTCQDDLTQGSTRAFTITNGTVQLKNGVTSTVGAFATSGTNQKFLQSSLAGSQATLSQASGTVNASYLTIQDINATGGATWNALWSNNNVDSGDNTGWFFGDQPIVNAVEYTYKIRSFTQPRRF
jgi:hypothetical protein